MKKIEHLIFVIIAFLGTAYFANAQKAKNQFLIDSLKSALFPDSKEYVEISNFFGHEKQQIDSNYLVRKIQPELEVVMTFLKQVAYSKDPDLQQAIIDLYDLQQSFFKEEWEAVHRNNIYACKAANEQFSILEAFETAIHSLDFGNSGFDRKTKIAYYNEYVKDQYSYYHVSGAWQDAINGWHIYSPYYMMLRENRWVAPPLGSFSFIEPYINEIDEYLIDELKNYYLNNNGVIEGSNRLPRKQFELDYLCGIISLSEIAEFNEDMIDLILLDKRGKPSYVRGRLLNLIKNPNYREHIKPILLNRTNSDDKTVRLNALYGLIFFHDLEVMTKYQKLLADPNTSVSEKQAISNHLLILNKQLNVSEETKEFGNKLLIQIKN